MKIFTRIHTYIIYMYVIYACLYKRCLPLGRRAMTNPDSILKSRNITLLTKIQIVKAMVFPVVMYGCVSWPIRKAEHQRFDAFEIWCWRRLLRVPWGARRSNQPILKEITLNIHWKDWCWSSKTLITWYKQPTHWKRPWWWERLKAGGEGGDRVWNSWMASLTPVDISLSELHREMVKDREVLHATVHGVAKSQTWLSHWATATTNTHTHTHTHTHTSRCASIYWSSKTYF